MDIRFEYILCMLVSSNFEYAPRVLEETNNENKPSMFMRTRTIKKENKTKKEYFLLWACFSRHDMCPPLVSIKT